MASQCRALVGIVLLFAFAVPGMCQENDSGQRTWVDNTGAYRIEAAFVKKDGNQVYLRKNDGKILVIPEERLSEADRQLAAKLSEQAKQHSASDTGNPFAATSELPQEKKPSRSELVQQVQRSIAYITIRDNLGTPQGLGSGFVVDTGGLIATNYHVIRAASSAVVKFRDGTEVEVAGYRALDKEHDLAILELKEAPADLKPLRFDPKCPIEQGDAVLAFGHPAGFEFTVTDGIVSAVRKTAEMPKGVGKILNSDPECSWIQISVPLVPGSSGGPLLDTSGNLLGINSWVFYGRGMAFAVHGRHLADLMKKLSKSVETLPVPGSKQGPGVRDPDVLAKLETFREDYGAFYRKVWSVQNGKARLEIIETEDPAVKCAAALLDLAAEKKGTRTAFEALISIARLAEMSRNVSVRLAGEATVRQHRETLRAAFEQILSDHADEPDVAPFCPELCELATEEVHNFCRTIVSRTSRDDVRGMGSFALASSLVNNPRTVGRAEDEAIACLQRAVDEFGDEQFNQETLKSIAEPLLMARKHLTMGRLAANIAGKDSQGREFQLTDHAGKVVLLDFWVDWCPFCRNMYPYERELLEKYGDRSLEILGINCDETDRLKEVEAGDKVTWRSWADGVKGPIAKKWQVHSYPTLYLLDHQGRIRLKGNVPGERLAQYIEPLLKEKELGLQFDVVAPCSAWNYLESAEWPGKSWRELEFDDSQWNSGRGPFGFGLDAEGTAVGQNEKVHTTYFRKRFSVPDAAAVNDLLLEVFFDDGVAVFLNGKKILRENLAPDTKASAPADKEAKGDGLVPRYIPLHSNQLKMGENILAVELHQHDPKSQDLHFDLNLSSGVELPTATRVQYLLDADDKNGALEEWTRAIDQDPENTQLLRERALLNVRIYKRWRAANDYLEVLDRDPSDVVDWSRAAVLLVLSEHEDQYRDHCATMLDQFRENSDLPTQNTLALTCLLTPDADLAAKIPLAALEKALDEGSDPDRQAWYWTTRALAVFRRGDTAKALGYVAEAKRLPAFEADVQLQALVLAVEALVLGATDQTGTAKQALAEATKFVANECPRLAKGYTGPWHCVLAAHILCHEAAKKD